VPHNKLHYDGEDDLLALAISLWLARARNHGFNDGNKRTATAAMVELLARNGYDLKIPDSQDHPLLGKLLESAIIGTIDEHDLGELLIHYIEDRP
jgi:death-on-curing protein